MNRFECQAFANWLETNDFFYLSAATILGNAIQFFFKKGEILIQLDELDGIRQNH